MNLYKKIKNVFSAPVMFNILLIMLFTSVIYAISKTKLDITIQTSGIAKSSSDTTSIGSMVTGQVESVNFKEGQTVKKNDVIVTIDPGVGYEKYNISANINGKIQFLYAKNSGTVIKQGQTVVVLLPENDECIVEAKLLIKDRGYVNVGQTVKIKLNNKDAIKFGPISGIIASISPDAVQDKNGSYYVVKINLDKQQFSYKDLTYKLFPGIEVTTFILTGDQTILDYIISPISTNISLALQEQ